MDYPSALEKLEHLRALIETYMPIWSRSTPESKELRDRICEAYGEVEEIIERVDGRREIDVPPLQGGMAPTVYPNFVEAGFLSGSTIHMYQGHSQLLKIIGKVRRLATDPSLLRDEASVALLLRTLNRFRECCQYVREPPQNEHEVQDFVWIMLRSHFDRVDRKTRFRSSAPRATDLISGCLSSRRSSR
jgi:hypothetical protein